MPNETPLMIVGAGPIGLELAIALTREGIEYVQVEAKRIGSTIQWYAPHTTFFSSPERISIGGAPLQTIDQSKANREEYLTYLRTVVDQFDLEVRTGTAVVSIESGEPHQVRLRHASGEETWSVEKLVLAIGDMHRPKMIGVAGETLPHVSHYFDDPHNYFRRRVLIVGGKNSAIEAAIRCVRVGAKVTLSYRGEDLDEKRIKFWLLPEIRAMIRDGRLRFLPRSNVTEIGPVIARLEVDGDEEVVEADDVLLLTGYEQDSTLFEQAGIELVGEGRVPRFDEVTMETNVPGIYVIGTASAGTQTGGVKEFIETSHIHVERVVAHLTGREAPEGEGESYTLPES